MPEVLSFFLLLSLVAVQATSLESPSKNVASENHILGKIGAIIDPSCRMGKEAKIAMEMAVEDFHHSNGSKLSIHMRDSHGNPLQDASTTRLLFSEAKQLGMMWKGYVWIINDDVTSLLDSVGSTLISTSMQGVIGTKTHVSTTTKDLNEFSARFRGRFQSEYPEEMNKQQGIYALRSYDAVHAIACSMQGMSFSGISSMAKLSERILSSDFTGLSGQIDLQNGRLESAPVFQIVNIVGKSYREMGFWSEQLGFYELAMEVEDKNSSCRGSMEVLGPVFWPGGAQKVPRGWMAISSASEKTLRIGVPARGVFTQFVKVGFDDQANKSLLVSGFSVDVFKAAMNRLPYHLPYQLIPHYGICFVLGPQYAFEIREPSGS